MTLVRVYHNPVLVREFGIATHEAHLLQLMERTLDVHAVNKKVGRDRDTTMK
jgi:hypothetical protein